jgi:hypothetical protein
VRPAPVHSPVTPARRVITANIAPRKAAPAESALPVITSASASPRNTDANTALIANLFGLMKTAFVFALILFVTSSAPAQTGASSTYTATEAARHVGENATVSDRVDGVHQSGKGNIFLNMGGKYPNQAFTAYIPAGSAGQFSDYRKYDGQTVTVSGKITLYHGKPEIIVSSPSQIVVR